MDLLKLVFPNVAGTEEKLPAGRQDLQSKLVAPELQFADVLGTVLTGAATSDLNGAAASEVKSKPAAQNSQASSSSEDLETGDNPEASFRPRPVEKAKAEVHPFALQNTPLSSNSGSAGKTATVHTHTEDVEAGSEEAIAKIGKASLASDAAKTVVGETPAVEAVGPSQKMPPVQNRAGEPLREPSIASTAQHKKASLASDAAKAVVRETSSVEAVGPLQKMPPVQNDLGEPLREPSNAPAAQHKPAADQKLPHVQHDSMEPTGAAKYGATQGANDLARDLGSSMTKAPRRAAAGETLPKDNAKEMSIASKAVPRDGALRVEGSAPSALPQNSKTDAASQPAFSVQEKQQTVNNKTEVTTATPLPKVDSPAPANAQPSRTGIAPEFSERSAHSSAPDQKTNRESKKLQVFDVEQARHPRSANAMQNAEGDGNIKIGQSFGAQHSKTTLAGGSVLKSTNTSPNYAITEPMVRDDSTPKAQKKAILWKSEAGSIPRSNLSFKNEQPSIGPRFVAEKFSVVRNTEESLSKGFAFETAKQGPASFVVEPSQIHRGNDAKPLSQTAPVTHVTLEKSAAQSANSEGNRRDSLVGSDVAHAFSKNAKANNAREVPGRSSEGTAPILAKIARAQPISSTLPISQSHLEGSVSRPGAEPQIDASAREAGSSTTGNTAGTQSAVTPVSAQPPIAAIRQLAQLANANSPSAMGQESEVLLNLRELGRVDMRIVTSAEGMLLSFSSERPDTYDLIRKHIDVVEREFRRMGHENITFEFSMSGHDGGGRGNEQQRSDGFEDMQEPETASAPIRSVLTGSSSTMDIRV